MDNIKYIEQLLQQNLWFLALIALWVLPWKGWALWKAVKSDDKKWFVALLLVQTLAVLEILYIFVFSKRKDKEVK